MKIAIPLVSGKLSSHFGHCDQFGIYEIEENKIVSTKMENPPGHEPGALPKWLKENGVTLVLAGGMGSRAQNLFESFGIHVSIGVPSWEPEEIVKAYLEDKLPQGNNICDH